MKKTLIITLILLLSFSAMAKVKVVSGSTAFLKEKAIAVVEFDYSEATFDNAQSYKSWCGDDYEERVERSTAEFIKSFNEKSKGLKINNNDTNAKYRIIVKVGDCDQNMGFSCNWGQLQFKSSGMITIVEVATNEVVCTLEVDEEKGGCDYTPIDRISECFGSIGYALAKQK